MTTIVETSRPGRLVWQTQPCPPWCEDLHRDRDHPEDRDHMGAQLEIPTRLAPAVEMVGGVWEPATWKIYLRQPQDGAPRLHMFNDDDAHMWVEFHPDEARQLVEAIQLVLGQIGSAS